ncbi:HIT domain-containing protein [Candidatus Woesearchaeota archaeon]|nr:HIT domain-containing protein [Candidatus Woesearchaeota archaeon]
MAEQPTEEQIKEFQEKVKNMSPEELKEFQKQQCIFCQIIDGKVASKKVYEDDICIGILDINPANPGHVLLMPKEHFPLMPLIPEDVIGHLFIVSKAISRVMLTAVNAEGADIFVANGSAAGQRAQHFMLHIIPRKTGDEVKMDIPVKKLAKKKVDEARQAIEEKINAVFKLKKIVAKPAKEVKKAEKPAKKKAAKEKKPTKKKAAKKEPEISLDDIAKLIK